MINHIATCAERADSAVPSRRTPFGSPAAVFYAKGLHIHPLKPFAMPTLTRIAVYPIKSMDPELVLSTGLVGEGALAFDRAYSFFGEDGKWLRAKRCPQLQQVRSRFNLETGDVTFTPPGEGEAVTFKLPDQADEAAAWFGDLIGERVTLKHAPEGGYPDETGNFEGPTLISTATLETVGDWFGGLPLEELRRRFRANLEVDGVPAFWEDRLLRSDGPTPRLRIGDVELYGFHPCARCVVPTRDSYTAEGDREFQKIFMARREASLPAWADRDCFNHYFRLAVNCHVDQATLSGSLSVGDELELLQ